MAIGSWSGKCLLVDNKVMISFSPSLIPMFPADLRILIVGDEDAEQQFSVM